MGPAWRGPAWRPPRSGLERSGLALAQREGIQSRSQDDVATATPLAGRSQGVLGVAGPDNDLTAHGGKGVTAQAKGSCPVVRHCRQTLQEALLVRAEELGSGPVFENPGLVVRDQMQCSQPGRRQGRLARAFSQHA